jgi:phenylacetic acid degradation operon negative regulatory protein
MGEFVLPYGGAVWTTTVLRGLGALGVEERNARQAVFRLVEQGTVRSERKGRRARLHLTEPGRKLLSTGSRRIYEFGAGKADWDGRWLVVLCFVTEDQRAKRHQLRTRLEFAGFGFLAPGVAISPHVELELEANEILEDLGLVAGAVVFRAETGLLVDARDLLRQGWDLTSLAGRYRDFLTSFERRAPAGGEESFAALIELVHSWRRFPFVDPEIPSRLLPDGWPGQLAKEVFSRCHSLWSPAARGWYEEIDAPLVADVQP